MHMCQNCLLSALSLLNTRNGAGRGAHLLATPVLNGLEALRPLLAGNATCAAGIVLGPWTLHHILCTRSCRDVQSMCRML